MATGQQLGKKKTFIGKSKGAKVKKDVSKERQKKIDQLLITDTHYLLILDESASMKKVKQQTLDGLNEQIQTIKALELKYPTQKYFISIVKFHTDITPLITDVPASEVKELIESDYTPDQMTALHDAIGMSVSEMKKRIQTKFDSGVATGVVVILTDGEENKSKEFKAEDIKILIDELNATNLWTFSFVGANQDAVLTSKKYGISTSNTMSYTGDAFGTMGAFSKLSSAISMRAQSMSIGNVSNLNYLSEDKLNNGILKNDKIDPKDEQ